MQTRNQKYAIAVLSKVEEIVRRHPDENAPERKKYGTMCHKLPVLIRTAGLAQALAFVQARGDDNQKKLLKDLADVLTKTNVDALLRDSREAHLSNYIRLTNEALAALLWFKRYAQSILKIELGEDQDDD